MGTVLSYHLQRKWFAVKYCDEIEEYSAAEIALLYYFSELLPTLFFLKFDFSVHVMADSRRNPPGLHSNPVYWVTV